MALNALALASITRSSTNNQCNTELLKCTEFEHFSFQVLVYHHHHYSVIVVLLQNSENDSKLKDWINCGIYLKNLLSNSRPWPVGLALHVFGLGFDLLVLALQLLAWLKSLSYCHSLNSVLMWCSAYYINCCCILHAKFL